LETFFQVSKLAFRRDWQEHALNGLRERIERLRKALGLRPGDRRWVRRTHAPHADAEYFEFRNACTEIAADIFILRRNCCAQT